MSPHLHHAATDADFAAASVLLLRMQAWDAAMTAATHGVADADMSALYAGSDAATLRQTFTAPRSGLMLATGPAGLLGCVGYVPLDDTTAEITKVFVDDAARGHGIAGRLLQSTLTTLSGAGYARTCLETATFMSPAIALYRAHGFAPCPPFRPAFDTLSLFFARDL